jgi:glycosyltransferase involved in cell wall biosynthesis
MGGKATAAPSVLHVITRLDRGGSADVALDLVRMLAADGYRVGIVTGLTADPQEDIDAFSLRYGIPVYRVPRLLRRISPLNDLLALCRIWLIIRRFRPDIVHTHTSKAGILGRFAAWSAGVRRIVHTPHGHIFYGYFSPGVARVFIAAERIAARITDRIVTLTRKGLEDHLAVRIGERDQFAVIPSGTDVGRFSCEDGGAVRAELGCGTRMVVGWAGRLAPVKDCATFLRAAATVISQHPDVCVLVAGDGEEREYLRSLAGELGIAANVCFLGDRRDMPRILAAMDVFVLSSLNEGFGRVIVEAMAAGTPVVSTEVGGTSEVIEDGVSGMLIPPGDPGRMADAVLSLLDNHEARARLRGNGLERAKFFDTRRMVDTYEQLYHELLGG